MIPFEEYKIEHLSDYEKNGFAKLTPVPQMDVWPMYKTIWPEE